MRFCLAIPTYWTHPEIDRPVKVIYDHPTPLNTAGTLRRTLESLATLVQRAPVVVVAASTAPQLDAAVYEQVRALIESPPLPYPVLLFSARHLELLRDFIATRGQAEWLPLLSLSGYAQVRNITLILANILASEVLVSLDDDEIISDPDFLTKISRDFAVLSQDYPIFGLGGLYQNLDGSILGPEPTTVWAAYWPKMPWMNAAFQALLVPEPPLKKTALALGGNLALSADLLKRLPFDPAISRGEDVDYVLNAMMFQIPFFLDHTLLVTHAPPEKPHPLWLRLRQDLQRFRYTRCKLRGQVSTPGLKEVTPEDLKPYPGNFLEDDLEIRAYRTHTLLALEYLAQGDSFAAQETLKNLLEAVPEGEGRNAFANYLDVVHRWQALQAWLTSGERALALRQTLWGDF